MENLACGGPRTILEAEPWEGPDRRRSGELRGTALGGELEARMGQVASQYGDPAQGNPGVGEEYGEPRSANVDSAESDTPDPRAEPEPSHWSRAEWERLRQRLQLQAERLKQPVSVGCSSR